MRERAVQEFAVHAYVEHLVSADQTVEEELESLALEGLDSDERVKRTEAR